MITTAARASKRLAQSCAQAARTAQAGPPVIRAQVQGGQLLVAVAELAAIEPPLEEGEDCNEADLLRPDKNEQNEEEEIEAIGVDLLEEYSMQMQMMR